MSLLIIKAGDTLPAIRQRRGDFEDWFADALGVDCTTVDVRHTALQRPPGHYSGALITGSAAMVSHRDPWAEATLPWLREAVQQIPVLGVCYGHQLLAHALGGVVGRNPLGRQIGTVAVDLKGAADDPLLSVLPEHFEVQATHQETVLPPPPGAQVLGYTVGDPYHVIRYNERSWSVQFHPEFDADIIRAYLQGRREDITTEGLDVDSLIAHAHDTPWGPRLLARFGELAGG